jgi:acyl-coenzyme A thioesterase PaaI-like protein
MSRLQNRKLSPWAMKWMLNLFPPLLFQRIKILEVSQDFQYCRVRVKRSIWTRNLHGTTFGGTIYSAADSPLPMLYWQLFAQRGLQVESWLQAGKIRYEKPAATELILEFRLSDEDVAWATAELESKGRFRQSIDIQAVDLNGTTCARISMEAYVRLARDEQGAHAAF